MRKGFVGLAVLVGCLLFLAADTAQAQNAQVVGTIKDESGAVIPGATVTATEYSLAAGATREFYIVTAVAP